MINYWSNYSVLSDTEKEKYEFSQCEFCDLYPCELISGYTLYRKNNPNSDSLSYNPKEQNYSCVMGGGLVRVKCDSGYVSDGIGDAFKINIIEAHDKKSGDLYSKVEETSDRMKVDRTIGRWEPTQPVFISAQTGSGKNHFIEKTLLPYIRKLNHAKNTNHRILILSNRIALRLQIQDRLKTGNIFPDFEDATVYSLGEYADVMMYQGFQNKVGYYKKQQQSSKSSFIFVICDEAHFFTSDAMFNPYTEKILSAVVNTFQKAIRIFMSATPYECLDYIMKCESNYTTAPNGYLPPPVLYHFKRDYSYLDIKYYSSFDELKGIIETENDENWLIFIDHKKKCEQLKVELDSISSLNGKVYTVSRESKNDDKYRKMVASERIDVSSKNQKGEENEKTKILLATSVIDNGVNFRNIQNIVISDISKVKCLQMVGRARVDKDKKITLYIKRLNGGQLERWIADLEKQQDAYHEHNMSKTGSEEKLRFLSKYYNNHDKNWKNAKHWFGRDIGDPAYVFPNEIACSLVDDVISTYTSILTEVNNAGFCELPGQRYLEYQLSWFGHTYIPGNDITFRDKDAGKKKLIEFLELYTDITIPEGKDGQDKFSIDCTNIIDVAFGRQDKNLGRPYKSNKLNKILTEYEIPFHINSEREGWAIVKQCESSDG